MPRSSGETTKSAIVDHAWKLFCRKAYDCTSVNEIVEAAGVSKGSFYFHFKSKGDLVAVVVEKHREHFISSVDKIFLGSDWQECARRLAQACFPGAGRGSFSVEPLVQLGVRFACCEPVLLDHAANSLASMEVRFAVALEGSGWSARESRSRAGSLMACLQGHFIRLALAGSKETPRALAEDISRFMMPKCADAVKPVSGSGAARGSFGRKAVAGFQKIAEKHLDIVDSRSIMAVGKAMGKGFNEKRSRILTEAGLQLWRHGYEGSRVSGILENCGIPKGSFYYYFDSKRSLTLEVLDAYGRFFADALDAVFCADDWPTAVDAFCRLLTWLAERFGVFVPAMTSLGLEFVGSDGELAEKVAGVLSGAERKFACAIRAYGGNSRSAGREAALAIALWKGHMSRLAIYRDAGILKHLRCDLTAIVS